MSVYTTVPEDLLKSFLAFYDEGELLSYTGISAGIENTNYFVTTTQGSYVLTLFETLEADEVPWYLELMHHLSAHGIPGADPVADKFERHLNALCGKPAALIYKLDGEHVPEPNVAQCAAIGHVMAAMHLAAATYTEVRANCRGVNWYTTAATQLMPRLALPENTLLITELDFQKTVPRDTLPQGVVHADLFHDNALFVGDKVSGVIDFYYACHDAWLYDVAVTINDWCSAADGSIDAEKAQALLQSYANTRAFTALEKQHWNAILRAAALRFWLSRLLDLHFPRAGEMTQIKDPNAFQQVLQWHIDHPDALPLP